MYELLKLTSNGCDLWAIPTEAVPLPAGYQNYECDVMDMMVGPLRSFRPELLLKLAMVRWYQVTDVSVKSIWLSDISPAKIVRQSFELPARICKV